LSCHSGFQTKVPVKEVSKDVAVIKRGGQPRPESKHKVEFTHWIPCKQGKRGKFRLESILMGYLSSFFQFCDELRLGKSDVAFSEDPRVRSKWSWETSSFPCPRCRRRGYKVQRRDQRKVYHRVPFPSAWFRSV